MGHHDRPGVCRLNQGAACLRTPGRAAFETPKSRRRSRDKEAEEVAKQRFLGTFWLYTAFVPAVRDFKDIHHVFSHPSSIDPWIYQIPPDSGSSDRPAAPGWPFDAPHCAPTGTDGCRHVRIQHPPAHSQLQTCQSPL